MPNQEEKNTFSSPQGHTKLIKGWPFILLIVLLLASKVFISLAMPKNKAFGSDLTAENILSAVNKERQLRNLVTLKTDSRLSAAGQSKSEDMIARHYFSHTDPEGNYIWPKIESAGYAPYLQLGENLAVEFYNTDSLLSAWMNSPTHRANILNEGFKDQGMGLAFGGNSDQYHSGITNTFGTLVANRTKAPSPATPPSKQTAQKIPAPKKTSLKKPASTKTSSPTLPIKPNSQPAALAETITAPAENIALSEIAQDKSVLLGKLKPRLSPQEGTLEPTASTTKDLALEAKNTGLPFLSSQASSTIANLSEIKIPESKSAYDLNQKIIFGFGLILLLLMIADIKIAAEKSLNFLDKKINNLAVLIISLIIIAFMYWM